jgi:PDZ domain
MMKRSATSGIAAAALLGAALAALPASRAQNGPPPPQPAASPSGAIVRFAYQGNVAQLPAEFIGNLVFVPVRVNQSQPSMFQLDTTADTSAINPARAAELGLSSLRSPVLNLTNVDALIPKLDSNAAGDFARRVGRSYEGTIGNDLLSDTVLEIAYGRQTVRLYDAGSFQYKGDGKSLPLTIHDGLPAVRAKVEFAGHKSGDVLFIINTALTAPLLISDRYAHEHHLFKGHVKTYPIAPGELGVPGNAVMARAEFFRIGPYDIPAPLAAFAEGQIPGADDPQVAGEIGGGMLRRFTVTIDYVRKIAYFEGNGQIRSDDHEDMSGISMEAGGPGLKTLEVTLVRSGSPGSDAGIQKGDVIEGIDDEATSDISVASARALFTNVGHKYKLLIDHDGKTRTVNLTMRRSL